MRITNQMISNNSLRNLQTSTNKLNTLNDQLTTGQKIQRPSEDPVVAVRALKLRTTVSQLAQYKNKNIKDAESWMDLTETSITSISNYLEYMSGYSTQGSTDSFNTDDRSAVADTIRAYKDMIYAEGGATYAGRYIFSGYKTDTSLVFTSSESTKYAYNITEELDGSAFDVKKETINPVEPSDIDKYLAGTATYDESAYPNQDTVYRIRLSYDALAEGTVPSISFKDEDGNTIDVAVNKTMTSTQAADYYSNMDGDEVRYIPETGEILFGKNIYSAMKDASNISINYDKDTFTENDLRPEHYFNCTQTEKATGKETAYTIPQDGQAIEYEVNFNQKIRVNTQGKDLIQHGMGRAIDELADKVEAVADAENRLQELNNMLKNPKYMNDEAAVKQINLMIQDCDSEVKMKKEEMQEMFSANISVFQNYQTDVTALQSDSGSRVSKLNMVATRVSDNYVNFTELMSSNEEVDYEETAVSYSSAQLIYNAALMTTGSVLQKTLLDFI